MASLFNSKHNKYVSIPDWFKDTDLNSKQQTVEYKTTYIGGGGSVVGATSGLSNIILYNKFVVEDTELGKEALAVIDTVLNATESETAKIGETTSLSGWNTTDYISVASNSIMIVTSYIDSELNKLYGILFYDNTRSVIGSHLLTSSPEEVKVPANSYYFRISTKATDDFKIIYKVSKEYNADQLLQSNNNITDYLLLNDIIPEGINETSVTDSTLKILVQSPLTLTRDLNNVIKLSMKQNNETNTNDMFVWDKKLAAFGFDITLGQAYSYIDGLQLFDSDGNPIMTNNPDFWLYDENLTDKWIIKSTRPRLSLLDNLFEYDSEKNCFILHSNLATTGGIVAYANTEDINIDDIYDGLPIDNQTLYWGDIKEEIGTDEEGNPIYKTTKVLKAKGGGSGGNGESLLSVQESGKGNAFTAFTYINGELTLVKETEFALQKDYDDISDIVGTLQGEFTAVVLSLGNKLDAYDFTSWKTTNEPKIEKGLTAYNWGDHSKVGYVEEKTLAAALNKYVDLDNPQTISGEKNFTGGLLVKGQKIEYIPIDDSKGYWKLEGDLLVTGGITSFASSSGYTPSTIMDAIVCDNQTITIEDVDGVKMLKVIGGSGGSTTASLTIQYENNGNAITALKYRDGVLTATKGETFATKDFVTNEITQKIDGVAYVEWVDRNFVNLTGYQTIPFIKNFEKGIEVNGQLLKYSEDNKCWVMEGDLLVSGGITAYGSESSFIPSTIMDAIVCDEQTITIEEKNGIKMLKVIGGGSTGSVDLSKYATIEYVNEQIAGLEGGGTIDLSSYAEKTWVSSNFASLEENNIFTKANNFKGGLFVNDKQIKYNSDGYWELEGDLLVTGGITSFASSSGYTPSTIMDAIVCDEQTITVDVINGIKTLKVIGGVGSNNELTVDKSGSGNAFTSYTYTDGKLTLFKETIFATANELNALSSTVDNKWTTDNTKINNWDKAFNWGNHASVGYVTSSSLTETLNDYVTVDGDEQEIKGKKNFTDGGLFVNGQQLVYNKDGYWKMEGNLLVTGGITAYSSDGKASPFLIDADTWKGITSNSATQVYSAKSVTLLKNEVKLVGEDADSALDKFDIIKEELSTLTESSLTTAIRTVLLNIREKI